MIIEQTLAQSTAFAINQDEGKLIILYQQESNIVFKIDPLNGDITSVYIFSNDSVASKFIINGDTRLIPLHSLPLGINFDSVVHIDHYSIIEYAKNTGSKLIDKFTFNLLNQLLYFGIIKNFNQVKSIRVISTAKIISFLGSNANIFIY